MADQKRWFKVWSSIALDPTFLSLPVEVVGRWTLLGAWIAAHGEKGQITASLTAIRHVLRIPENDNGVSAVKALPHVRVEEGQNDNDDITVIMLNWAKYQEDSTVYERVKKWRKAKSVTVQEEKRREEKRREKKNLKTSVADAPDLPLGDSPKKPMTAHQAVVESYNWTFESLYKSKPSLSTYGYSQVKVLANNREAFEAAWIVYDYLKKPLVIVDGKCKTNIQDIVFHAGAILSRTPPNRRSLPKELLERIGVQNGTGTHQGQEHVPDHHGPPAGSAGEADRSERTTPASPKGDVTT